MAGLPSGLRIRELRKAREWSQEELADRVGSTKATISKLELSTRRLDLDWLERLSGAFGVKAGTLLDNLGTPERSRFREVPVIGMIAAGNWREAIEAPDGWVAAMDVPEDAFALQPMGNSMDLIAPEGTFAIVTPSTKHLSDGGIYAIANDEGETTLKYFRADPARLEPSSTDPSHQPIYVGDRPFTVIGRVSQIIRRV